jgi:hypothetical protein
MANPIRIYVLHHPDSRTDPVTKLEKGLAASLTNRIYDWFRLPSLEGIPVYVRTAPEEGSERPAMPYRKPGDQCLEYLVPLVDAHMVRDPVWHEYLADLAKMCAESKQESRPEWGLKMFPVALDSTAFNLPDGIARMNFIRHGSGTPPGMVVPGAPDEEEQKRKKVELDTGETLKHLTEALARDLNARLFPAQRGERFKIFISYARADGTEQAKALRTYIQSQTQCLVFFDENDIGFGSAFDEVIANNVGEYSKALIVLNSDFYAERPWCRLEIDRFTRPRKLPISDGKGKGESFVNVFHPVLVVDNLAGPKMSRMVPELAQAPVVRWGQDREKLYFSTLMREVVLGLRDVLEARTIKWGDLSDAVVVNRLPGPVTLARLLPGGIGVQRKKLFTVHHPGHGMPFTELRLLEKTFPNVYFHAFRDITFYMDSAMKKAMVKMERNHDELPPLRGKVIAVSTAYHRDDLARLGYLPQHQDEALIYLLRPLVRLGADLLYGGRPPKKGMEAVIDSGLMERNITLTLMQLLSAERRVEEYDPKVKRPIAPPAGPLLFNVSSWPACNKITEVDEAAWINACRVQRVLPQDAGLPAWKGPVPGEHDVPPPGFRRHLALTFSHTRKILAHGFTCKVPGNLQRAVRPAAFVFIGGVTDIFKGVMPGVMEEFLNAALARPAIPIYLVGGLGGATGVIARALLDDQAKQPPPELTQKFYQKSSNQEEYNLLLKDFDREGRAMVRRKFAELWRVIHERHVSNGLDNLFVNGLSHEENTKLLTEKNATAAVCLIWKGMSKVLLSDSQPEAVTTPPAAKKSPKQRRMRRK